MFDIGGAELLLIVLVVLVLFGPKKLPELAQSLGRGMREFKRAQREFTDQINMAVREEEQKKREPLETRPPENVVARDSARRPVPIPPPPDEMPAQPSTPADPGEPSSPPDRPEGPPTAV